MSQDLQNEKQLSGQRVLIVGGVAGGASCATRARRLSEEANIIVFDRGPYVSFANCGLPYYVGNVITDEKDLVVTTPEVFNNMFNIEVRLHSDVQAIDYANNEIIVKELETGRVYREQYDSLVLATGSQPVRPQLPGIDMPGIFTLRTIPDSQLIKDWIVKGNVKEAIVVGGGLIGLEMTENLTRLGISVTIVEMLPHVLPTFDPEIAVQVHENLESNGVNLFLGSPVTGFSRSDGNARIEVMTSSDKKARGDMVILAIGSRPEVTLARDAGLEIGELGGIRVNDQMQTSNKQIWAVGDVVEVRDFVTGEWTLAPFGGPASRQGRVAADAIFGRNRKFRGVQHTAVCQIFGMTIASTGVSERTLKRYADRGKTIPYEKVYLYPQSHGEYYPQAKPIAIKLIFSPEDGRVLGAQAVGEEGVEKRIDVIAMAIQMGARVYDLEEAELCYAPQVGSAKDAVNLAGMVAANILRGDVEIEHWDNIRQTESVVLDVREPDEFAQGHEERAVNIPLGSLRQSIEKLDRNRDISVYCEHGKRSYYACRILRLNGFNCRNVSGGYTTYQILQKLE
jgi:NADPH-dependent 2,4-dienoyl-CoA reductase/sulfur reductase-like enzyme/rhodanese-related sulfurtransferase